ncbi:c-type cytochrome [Maliponia aquimaris]|uniref:Alcohol dehydrogenase cytochrome c subunit n=1 Tax=Maliponia aquimaris TaxID=1673631 RepID=A0A238JSH4_9RHOB|nr:cytochrome c [Maliponia aquimaris]SMX33124.1 Alcohol dehydrogenase cytochrome c subunit precursor [Maliponia aquimaris]
MLPSTTALISASAIALSVALMGLPQGGAAAEDALVAVDTAVPSEVLAQGEALYLKNCRLCHGTKGKSGKPLAGNDMLEDAEYVASVILVGPGYMAAFEDHLSDDEIALIVTYVRNAWGHAYGPVDASIVAPLR